MLNKAFGKITPELSVRMFSIAIIVQVQKNSRNERKDDTKVFELERLKIN